jgi:8-oxo-dGDP phosphatase
MENVMIAVIVVITNDEGKFLLIQESKKECRGKWFFPGGRVNSGESILDAANREVIEEAGIQIELTNLLYIDQNVLNDRIRFVFMGKYLSGNLKKVEDEHSMMSAWKSSTEIEKLELRSPIVQKIINVQKTTTQYLDKGNFHVLYPEEVSQEMP